MLVHGYRRISQNHSNPNRTLKLIAQSGYYFVIAVILFGAFIQEATGNVKKASLLSDEFVRSAATCQIPLAHTQKRGLSCAPELASGGIFNWYPPMDFRKPFFEPNSSKQKGESHDYN